MTKVNIKLHDKEYTVSCEDNEVARLQEIVKYVDKKMVDISKRAEGMSEIRVFLLTCLTLADELTESRRAGSVKTSAEEDIMVAAVNHLNHRVTNIANRIGKV